MRHSYLDRAFSLLALCAALGCGGDDKSSSSSSGDGPEDQNPPSDAKPVTAVDFAKIDKSKKLSALSAGEVKGLCIETRDALVASYIGSCRISAVTGAIGEECGEALEGCDDSLVALDETLLKTLCDSIPAYSDDCSLTVTQYIACQKELGEFYEGLQCTEDGEAPAPPDCFEGYSACLAF